MYRNSLVLATLILCFHSLVAGIYRHDKTEKDHSALAAQPQFDCVGRLFFKSSENKQPEGAGSCVLIGSKYVLTAAHVLMESLTSEDTIIYEGKEIIVNQPYGEYAKDITSYTCEFKGKKYRCKAFHIYPSYLDCASKHKSDIALIELRDPVTAIQPAALCHSFDELNSPIVGVGFGANGFADRPADVGTSGPRKLAGENRIDSLCGYKINGQFVSMLCDFDHPEKPAGNRMGSSDALPLEYTTGGGDSGGGAFRKTGKGWELVGICGGSEHGGVDIKLLITEGIGYYNQVMEWQRVSVFADWIDKKMK